MGSRPRSTLSFPTLAFALVPLAVAAASAPSACAGRPSCELNSDCNQAYCLDGECVRDCSVAELDCPRGYVCSAIGKCEPDVPGASGASGVGGGSSAGPAGSGGAPTGSGGSGTGEPTANAASSASSSGAGPSGSGGAGGGGPLLELDLCASDAECADPLLCRALVVGGEKRCTRPCASSNDCPAGTRCETIGGASYCAGTDVGRACDGANDCNFGCLGDYCTAACDTAADCPNGYGCMGVGSPPQRVCVRAEAPCTSQDASLCIAPAACDESSQLVVGSCTLACDTAADCPQRALGLPPWKCTSGICRRPPDVFGPLEGGYQPAQYACNAALQVVNVCGDGQHIDFASFSIPPPPPVDCNALVTTDGAPGDACLNSCRYQGGCRFGFACTAVGQVGGSRIGLCLPTGAGEVGAACTTDGQCAFGYCNQGKCSRDCTADGVCPSGSTCVAAGGPPVEGLPFKRCE